MIETVPFSKSVGFTTTVAPFDSFQTVTPICGRVLSFMILPGVGGVVMSAVGMACSSQGGMSAFSTSVTISRTRASASDSPSGSETSTTRFSAPPKG